MRSKKQKTIVTIGGGTGQFVVLSGLKEFRKKFNFSLKAIVSMADDGGSTGRLRDELGVLPPGDIRQCLVALSESSLTMRKLFNWRFKKGSLKGHSLGNLFLSALEGMTGSLEKAIEEISSVFRIQGEVIPVTLEKIDLVAQLNNSQIIYGEHNINTSKKIKKVGIKKLCLSHTARANSKAKEAIKKADLIVIGPGNLYCSLIPNFLVKGIVESLKESSAKKILVVNLMNKIGHTDGFFVDDYLKIIEKYTFPKMIDIVIYNQKNPSPLLLEKYKKEGKPPKFRKVKGISAKFYGFNLLSKEIYQKDPADSLSRTLIRHDPKKLAQAILKFL